MLHEKIKAEIKEAMLARDTVRLDVLRGMSTAFTNELVATNRKPQELLSDEEVLAVITRLAKQRKDSIEQFSKGGRMDLVAEEEAQLKIIAAYLPELMGEDDIRAHVMAAKDHGFDPAKKGMFMASVMKDLKGKADGAVVKRIVDELI